MRREKPTYKLTNTSWEGTKLIWWRWALGDTKSAILRFFDLNRGNKEYEEVPRHRDTIAKVISEFALYPKEHIIEFVKEYPETEQFVIGQRPDLQTYQEVPIEHSEADTNIDSVHNTEQQEENNKVDALKLQHDREKFIESETILTEKKLDTLLYRLLGLRFFMEEAAMLEKYLRFFDMESPRQVTCEAGTIAASYRRIFREHFSALYHELRSSEIETMRADTSHPPDRLIINFLSERGQRRGRG